MSNFFYQESKRIFLSPFKTIKSTLRPKVLIPIISLSAIISVGTVLEEAREVSIINKLYGQNGGTLPSNLDSPYIYNRQEFNTKIDYLQQKGINPDIPFINYLRTHSNNRQKN